MQTISERAGVSNIVEGSNLKDFDINIPAQESTHLVHGVLLYSDGKPESDEFIKFKSDAVRVGYDGETSTKTDSYGNFSLKVLHGLKGPLYGLMFT